MAAHVCPPGYLAAQAAVARGPLLFSGALSEGQFYSPPESFAGEGWWVGELPPGRGFMRSRMAGSVLSRPLSAPWRKRAALSHTQSYPPTHHCICTPIPHPHPFSPPLPVVLHACFSAGSDNESDDEIVGKKSFSAQVFGCLPLPGVGTPERSQHWARPAGQGLPRGGQTLGSLKACQCPSECLAHCQSGPVVSFLPGPWGNNHSTWSPGAQQAQETSPNPASGHPAESGL